ncbi:39S ribosomal protein L54, mitochondrial [Sitodiplosis mosellana]|uniref:39S ribosomal protein L54, mitochondrial n=1 Tax=Sitodiplosis mosellana TaxID=263140 RepID=UPI002444A953|nr:39S ribosomal protein L54, mitochondrial [Sitodiplosis mosellana]
MNVQMFNSRLLTVGQRFSCLLLSRNYAKPAKKTAAAATKTKVGKAGPIVDKITFPAEKDTNKLVNYVCGSNIYTEGEDIKLKPESEYPDWLWEIHTGPPKKLEELDPNTKAYWRRVRKMTCRQNNRLETTKRRHLY